MFLRWPWPLLRKHTPVSRGPFNKPTAGHHTSQPQIQSARFSKVLRPVDPNRKQGSPAPVRKRVPGPGFGLDTTFYRDVSFQWIKPLCMSSIGLVQFSVSHIYKKAFHRNTISYPKCHNISRLYDSKIIKLIKLK